MAKAVAMATFCSVVIVAVLVAAMTVVVVVVDPESAAVAMVPNNPVGAADTALVASAVGRTAAESTMPRRVSSPCN